MKTIFTLSGKKKFLVTICGLAAIVAATQFKAAGSAIIPVAGVVAAYLAAETTLDRQRIVNGLITSVLYHLEKVGPLPAALIETLQKAFSFKLVK